MDFSVNRFVHVADAALDGHFDRSTDVMLPELVEMSASNAALPGSRTCTLPDPVRISHDAGLGTLGGHVAAACFAVEPALDAAHVDVSGARVQVDVAGVSFFNLNVAAAGAAIHNARDLSARARRLIQSADEFRRLSFASFTSPDPVCMSAFPRVPSTI